MSDEPNPTSEMMATPEADSLSASEALYGFCAWLSGREGTLSVGAFHPLCALATLAGEFWYANNFAPTREGWDKRVRYPTDDTTPKEATECRQHHRLAGCVHGRAGGGKMSDELKWKQVGKGNFHRIPVPGGWVYSEEGTGLVFVPDPTPSFIPYPPNPLLSVRDDLQTARTANQGETDEYR